MDRSTLIKHAAALIEQEFVGVFITTDEAGTPHARLMGAALEQSDTPTRLYSLCGHATRKVEHLRRNPRVCWLFHSPDHGKVVQLTGDARAAATAQLPDAIYHKLNDLARPYAEQSVRDEPHFSFDVIETRIDTVELLGRDYGLVTPAVVTL